jgi:hypothetical protein
MDSASAGTAGRTSIMLKIVARAEALLEGQENLRADGKHWACSLSQGDWVS